MSHELTPGAALAQLLTGAAAGIQAAIAAEREAELLRWSLVTMRDAMTCDEADAIQSWLDAYDAKETR